MGESFLELPALCRRPTRGQGQRPAAPSFRILRHVLALSLRNVLACSSLVLQRRSSSTLATTAKWPPRASAYEAATK